MQTQVKAWGNSQGIRLPKDILQEANVEINDMLEVKVSDGMIMLVKTFRHQKLEERAEKFGGKLNLDGEYEWDKRSEERRVGKECRSRGSPYH